MTINWKQKLSSRKFWITAAAEIILVLKAFHISSDVQTQVAAIIGIVGMAVVYLFSNVQASKVYHENKNKR